MIDTSSANPADNVAKDLRPTMATTNAALLSTNVLHEIDQAAQAVISKITEAQTNSGGLTPGIVHLGEGVGSLNIQHDVSLAELRRLKRSYLKLATKITFSRIQSSDVARRLFVDYLREQLVQQ